MNNRAGNGARIWSLTKTVGRSYNHMTTKVPSGRGLFQRWASALWPGDRMPARDSDRGFNGRPARSGR